MLKNYLSNLVATAEKNYIDRLINSVKSIGSKSFVDIGCFDGALTKKISTSIGADIVNGIEIEKNAIKKATEKGINIIKQDISLKKWDINSNSFDFVFSNQVIEHLYSVDNFILEIKRVLVNDGYLLLSTENLAAWHNIFSLLLGYQPFCYTNMSTKLWSIGNPMSLVKTGYNNEYMIHRAVFTFYSLREFIKIYDFEVISSITSGYYPFPNNWFGNKLAQLDKRHSVYIAFLLKNKK